MTFSQFSELCEIRFQARNDQKCSLSVEIQRGQTLSVACSILSQLSGSHSASERAPSLHLWRLWREWLFGTPSTPSPPASLPLAPAGRGRGVEPTGTTGRMAFCSRGGLFLLFLSFFKFLDRPKVPSVSKCIQFYFRLRPLPVPIRSELYIRQTLLVEQYRFSKK